MWNQADEFDFRIMPTPKLLKRQLEKKLEEKSQLGWRQAFAGHGLSLANGTLVDDVVIGDYVRPWNAKSNSGSLAPGIPKESLWRTTHVA